MSAPRRRLLSLRMSGFLGLVPGLAAVMAEIDLLSSRERILLVTAGGLCISCIKLRPASLLIPEVSGGPGRRALSKRRTVNYLLSHGCRSGYVQETS